jgi:hypothetical protein
MPNRRPIRRFLRKSRGPVAYVFLLAATLSLFLLSVRSCALEEESRPPAETRTVGAAA